MADNRRPCPVPQCGAMVPPHHLLCRSCWHQVPAEIQRRVYAAWRKIRAARTVEDLMPARDEHQAARADAIAAVEQQRP